MALRTRTRPGERGQQRTGFALPCELISEDGVFLGPPGPTVVRTFNGTENSCGKTRLPWSLPTEGSRVARTAGRGRNSRNEEVFEQLLNLGLLPPAWGEARPRTRWRGQRRPQVWSTGREDVMLSDRQARVAGVPG